MTLILVILNDPIVLLLPNIYFHKLFHKTFTTSVITDFINDTNVENYTTATDNSIAINSISR